jgi:ubiquinone/menaquinone biosynthesis C-methylase UbiE
MSFLGVLHKAASIGWVYDSIQFIAGGSIIHSHLRRYLGDCHGRVLDIGGGTGSLFALLPPGCSYTCLDNEIPKLQRCAEKVPGGSLYADATRMPVKSGSIDVVTCVGVTHHLTPDQLDAVLQESARVLNSKGSLILMDSVLKRTRLPGLILWSLDRGRYPKPSSELRRALERYFQVEQWDRFYTIHECVITVCRPAAAQNGSN